MDNIDVIDVNKENNKEIDNLVNFLKTFENDLYDYNLQIVTRSGDVISFMFSSNADVIDPFSYRNKIKRAIKLCNKIPVNTISRLLLKFSHLNITKIILGKDGSSFDNTNSYNNYQPDYLPQPNPNQICDGNCNGSCENMSVSDPNLPVFLNEIGTNRPIEGYSKLSKENQNFLNNFIKEFKDSAKNLLSNNTQNKKSTNEDILEKIKQFIKDIDERSIPRTIALDYLYENGIAISLNNFSPLIDGEDDEINL